jgi:hypothetical protein
MKYNTHMCYSIGIVFITLVYTINIIADNKINTDTQAIFIVITGEPHL